MQSPLSDSPTESAWQEFSPLLAEAMLHLGQTDRDALVLRYFQNKSLQQVAAALGLQERAAQKRVSRSVEKLRAFFQKRGIKLSVAVIVAALSANSVQAAPTALTATVAAAAAAKGAAASGSTLTLIKGTLKLMAWTKLKITAAVGAVALLATVTTTVTIKTINYVRLNNNLARAKSGARPDESEVAKAAANTKVLIFRNIPSWNRNPDFEDDLSALHFKYDVKSSKEMAKTDLTPYDFVIIPGAQWRTGFYRNFNENEALFEQYVSTGGTLLVEMNGAESEGITLPGGVRMVMHGAVVNWLTLPDHPILVPMGGKPLEANYSSHGYLTGVPKNASILATEVNWKGPMRDKPTFIEYTYGSGRVIAACQCFHDRDGSGRGVLMQTSIGYAALKRWYSPK